MPYTYDQTTLRLYRIMDEVYFQEFANGGRVLQHPFVFDVNTSLLGLGNTCSRQNNSLISLSSSDVLMSIRLK